ncbi:MAG: IS4 family transposase [Candidatus Babeliales bacterium]
MHVLTILHNLFASCRSSFDLRTLKTLFCTVDALIKCRKLSIASLGRSLKRDCYVKHKIKTVDRLFGNKKLHINLTLFYKAMLKTIIGSNVNPIIIIDWSGLTPCGGYHFIRAAVPLGGRALPILEIPYELKDYTKAKVHMIFLKHLRNILPRDCKPIILTDAGFRNPWFKLVLSFGWDYIGRIRQNTTCRKLNNTDWVHVKELYKTANLRAKNLGRFYLAKGNSLETNLYVIKEKHKNRIKKNLAGKKIQCSSSLKHEKRESEPLLLASSLSSDKISSKQIVNIYQKRMQIEEGFRDLKNERSGFSLRQNRSMSLGRLSVALLIGAIAMLILWVLGIAAKNRKLHVHFQANTIKNKNVLSIFMIGWQVLEEGKTMFNYHEIKQSLIVLQDAQYA